MTNDDFYTKEFFFGRISISRSELESLPCPFCTKDVTDEQMQAIINETCLNTKDRMRLPDDAAIDLSDDKTNEIWWEELEKAINSFHVPYCEDLDE
jgi:hypothetical protein